MWYNTNTSDTIVFTDVDGQPIPVLELLEIDSTPSQTLIGKVPCTGTTMLDEIASRKEFYGEDMEGNAHKIFNENIVELTERDFDLSKLSSLRVPQ